MSFPASISDQRVIAVPIGIARVSRSLIAGAGVTTLGNINLGGPAIAAAIAQLYVHFVYANGMKTAAASAMDITIQWQFFNAVPAAVGAAIPVCDFSVGWNGAAAAGVVNAFHFAPANPHRIQSAVPGGAVSVSLQALGAAVAGVPNIAVCTGFNTDITNPGGPGDIGGAGMIAQGTGNINNF